MHPGPNKKGTRGHPSAHEPKPKQCCEQCRCPVEKIWRELNPRPLPLFRIRGEKVKAGTDTAPTAGRARPGWDRDRDKATCLSPCLKGPSPAPCPLSTRGPGAAPGSGHSSSLPILTGTETSAPPQPPPLTPSFLPCPPRSAPLQSSGLQLQPPRPSLRHANHGIWGEGASWEPTSHSFFPVWGDVWGQGARTGGGCLKGPCRSRSNNRHRNAPTRLFPKALRAPGRASPLHRYAHIDRPPHGHNLC